MTDAKAKFLRGIDLLRRDQWDEALGVLELVAQCQKGLDSIDQTHLLIALSVVYIGAGDFPSARKVLSAAKHLPRSSYLPDKFVASLTATLDGEVEAAPPVPGTVVPKGESVIMNRDKPVVTARGNPVTTERIMEKNVITTAALRRTPTAEDLTNQIVNDITGAIFRAAEDRIGTRKPKKAWWKFW